VAAGEALTDTDLTTSGALDGAVASSVGQCCGGVRGSQVTYEEVIADVVKAVEAVGVAIMVVGGVVAFAQQAWQLWRHDTRKGSYERLRRDLGRVILLGLEVLIIADIVRTVVVEPTFESVAVLGSIVVIRIILSFSLEVEIDGVWPWARRRAGGSPPTPPS
jgi:uncharacterized membrane protein